LTTLSIIALVLIFLIICWKVTDMKKLLAPKLKKAEPQIGDFIVHANVQMDGEAGAHDMALNPVVQARLLIEKEEAEGRGHVKRNFAAGALRKLGLHIDHKHKDDRSGAQGLQRVDVALMEEEKVAKKAAAARRKDEQMIRDAEAAARDAQKMVRGQWL